MQPEIESDKQPTSGKTELSKIICPSNPNVSAESHKLLKFNKGDFIFKPEEASQQIYVVDNGRVKIGSFSSMGKEIIKSILYPGELFGEHVVFGESNRTEFAQAIDDQVSVCELSLEGLQRLISLDHNFLYQISQILGERLRKVEKRVESLLHKDARTRIVDYVKEMAMEQGSKVGEEILVSNFLTHREIGGLTGTSRQTVTSVLNELREKNLIVFDRKKLLVRDVSRLI